MRQPIAAVETEEQTQKESLRTPMARRGHSDATEPSDQCWGGVVFHQYLHDGCVWENGVTINDPAPNDMGATEAATVEDLDRWSARSAK